MFAKKMIEKKKVFQRFSANRSLIFQTGGKTATLQPYLKTESMHNWQARSVVAIKKREKRTTECRRFHVPLRFTWNAWL